jgi:hypothetical protein
VPTYHSAFAESSASSRGPKATAFAPRTAAPASTTSADEDDAPPFGGMLESTTKSKPRAATLPNFERAKKQEPLT